MERINMGSPNAGERIKALHENLDHALSCLSGMQQPMMSTDKLTKEDEDKAHAQLDAEMYEAVELIIASIYGGENGSGFVFKV